MDVVSSIADRVAVMSSARVVEQGNVYDVFSNPQTDVAKLFVATTVKVAPHRQEAAELRANHKGYLINVEIVEGNQGSVRCCPTWAPVTSASTLWAAVLNPCRAKAYGTLTLELLGEITSIDAAVAELKTVARVQEVR